MASSKLISLINNLKHVLDWANKLIICFVAGHKKSFSISLYN